MLESECLHLLLDWLLSEIMSVMLLCGYLQVFEATSLSNVGILRLCLGIKNLGSSHLAIIIWKRLIKALSTVYFWNEAKRTEESTTPRILGNPWSPDEHTRDTRIARWCISLKRSMRSWLWRYGCYSLTDWSARPTLSVRLEADRHEDITSGGI